MGLIGPQCVETDALFMEALGLGQWRVNVGLTEKAQALGSRKESLSFSSDGSSGHCWGVRNKVLIGLVEGRS